MTLLAVAAKHGRGFGAIAMAFDVEGLYGNGPNLYQYLGSNPSNRSDPLGLEYDPFDMVDEYLAESSGNRAAFISQLGMQAKAMAIVAATIASYLPFAGPVGDLALYALGAQSAGATAAGLTRVISSFIWTYSPGDVHRYRPRNSPFLRGVRFFWPPAQRGIPYAFPRVYGGRSGPPSAVVLQIWKDEEIIMNRALALALVAGALTSVAHAQTDWAAAVSGNWSNAANWSPMDVPDTAGESARFALGGGYTVSMSISPTIDDLLINAAGVTLDINAARTLTMGGTTLNNMGTIRLNPIGSASNATVVISSPIALTGTGTIDLLSSGNDSTLGGSGLLTQALGHTIRGTGQVTVALVNNGVVRADTAVAVTGTGMSLAVSPMVNNNDFIAADLSTLAISTSVDQTGGGRLFADLGTITLSGSTITGGTIEATGPTGLTRIIGNTTFVDVTNLGPLDIDLARTLTINGSFLTNNGTIRVNPQNSISDATLSFDGATTLDGTGTVEMISAGSNSTLRTIDPTIVTQGADHTIEGTGMVSAAMVNNGTIIADTAVATSGTQMLLNTNDKANAGIMAAAPASTLEINGITVTQTGAGQLMAMDTGLIEFANATLVGGPINALGTGMWEIDLSSTFQDVTSNAPGAINSARTLTVTGAGLTNNDVIQVNPTNSISDAFLVYPNSGALNGTGEVRLVGSGGNSQINTGAGATITQGSSHLIRGVGTINASMINNGTITADSTAALSGTQLTLTSNDKTNAGNMVAAAASTLEINGITVSQTGAGQLLVMDTGLIEFANATLIGGPINALGTGMWEIDLSSTFQDVTSNAPGAINPARTLTVTGAGLTNNDVIQVNPTNNISDAFLVYPNSGTLDGTGEVRLVGSGGNSQINTGAGATITQGPLHIIRGTGTINAGVTNNGQIIADAALGAGTEMVLATNDKTNNAQYIVETGSIMEIRSITVTQNPGASIAIEDGGNLEFANATLIDGPINGTGTGFWEVNLSSTFQDVTSNAPGAINPARTLTVTGAGLTNNDVIQVNPTNSVSDAFLVYPNSGTLDGTGEVRLVGSGGNSQINATAGEVVTNGPDHTVSGIGTINADFANAGTVTPGFSAGTMTINGTFDNAASGTLDFEIGGTGASQHDRFVGSGDYTLAGTLNVTIIDGFVPVIGDSFPIIRGTSRAGEFDVTNLPPPVGGSRWVVGYRSDGVDLVITCTADLTTSVDPNNPGFGVPDGLIDANDFFFYLGLFGAGDPAADLTGSIDPNNPSFGVPDGVLDANDFFFYLGLFAAGCV